MSTSIEFIDRHCRQASGARLQGLESQAKSLLASGYEIDDLIIVVRRDVPSPVVTTTNESVKVKYHPDSAIVPRWVLDEHIPQQPDQLVDLAFAWSRTPNA